MRVFIAGIMQGSRTDTDIDAQDYRTRIGQILRTALPGVEVVDPLALHPDSVSYTPEKAKQTLIELVTLTGQMDALVAYVPSASMGTALEMWHAYRHNVPVYTISPMTSNWVIRSLSTEVFDTLAAFAAFVADGGLGSLGGPA
jgi:hypothetical protein